MTVKNKAGTVAREGNFQTTRGHKVYQGGAEIGNWEREEDKTTIQITKGKVDGALEPTQVGTGAKDSDRSRNKAVLKLVGD